MPEFVTFAMAKDIPPGTGRTVEVQRVWIALFNVDGSFYAVDNTCPHTGGPLGEGPLAFQWEVCLRDPGTMLTLFQQLRNEKTVKLDVLRNNQRTAMTFDIR